MIRRHSLVPSARSAKPMRYYTVEGIVFSAWCEHHLPYPRGSQIAHQAQFKGMAVAIESLRLDDLATWIIWRDQVEAALGAAFMPDATLKRTHVYEQARERIAAAPALVGMAVPPLGGIRLVSGPTPLLEAAIHEALGTEIIQRI